VDLLIRDVVSGAIRPGQLLPSEPRLVETFGTSRTVVREALRVLSTIGLIQIEHGRGARVLPRETWDIFDASVIRGLQSGSLMPIFEDLLEVRRFIEVETAALAALRPGPGPGAGPAIYAEIDTASFSTGNPQRDQTVLSARFLDATRFPVITFRDGHVSADNRTLRGTLPVGEVSRPVTLSLGQVTVIGRSFTASATLRVDRTEFDLTAMRGLAGRYLNLTAEVRFAPGTPHA